MAEAGETTTAVGHEEHVEPKAWGLDPPAWIALAMVVVFAIMFWKNVHKAIADALDSKIATIRDQLAEAETLRKEAEALKAEYEKKAKSADKESAAMLERAQKEADEILAKGKRETDTLVKRRMRMAEEKIAAEERAAIEQLRAAAADAATKAAARLIIESGDAASDARVVDQAIAGIAAR